MATDGVKIIDGDSAFDIYASFMDAYDAGADVSALRQMYKQDKEQYSFDDCEYEICITVYALAFWEIGELTPDIFSEVEAVIAKGAGVEDWTEQVSDKAGKARQKELDKLLIKITKPNTKIRKRKKYAKVKELIFNPGDVLAFRFPDNTYGLTVVVDNMQYRGECDYMFCRTSFNSKEKPTMENLDDLHIWGSYVPTGGGGLDLDMLNKLSDLSVDEMKDGAVNRMLEQLTTSMPKLKMPWVMVIQHKNLLSEDYRNNFEKIGEIQLRSNCGSSRYAPSYADFCAGFYAKDYEDRNDQPFMPETGEFTINDLQQQNTKRNANPSKK